MSLGEIEIKILKILSDKTNYKSEYIGVIHKTTTKILNVTEKELYPILLSLKSINLIYYPIDDSAKLTKEGSRYLDKQQAPLVRQGISTKKKWYININFLNFFNKLQ